MKVLAIQGSPHRGNTYDRVEAFGEALTALGDVEFEHVELMNARLEPCRGCFLCFSRGEDSCPLSDDGASLLMKLDNADAVVFASPVYSMHVSYLLKLFVDRFAYTFHRPRYFGRYAVGIAVAGGVGIKETLEYIRMFSEAWGFEYVDELGYADPPRNSDLPRFMKKRDRVEDVARNLHDMMMTRPPRRLSRNDHFAFHAMRAVYGRMEDYSPVDYKYWQDQGWLDPKVRYFTEHARVGFLKGIYPRLVALMMGRAIDKGLSSQKNGAGE